MSMNESNGQSSPEDHDGHTSWDDFEYLEWVRAREQEALESRLPKKVTLKEMLLRASLFLSSL